MSTRCLSAKKDNGNVSEWADQSGNGYDASQSTAANRP